VKSAVSSRLWALLVAAVIDVFAATWLVGSCIWLIIGSRAGSAGLVGSAIVNGLHAIVWIVWGLFLHNYCSKLSTLTYSEDMDALEDSQDALRAFWTFTCIYLIVLLTFLAVIVVYAFAVGVTVPRWNLNSGH
jgi:hypothetical protein